MSKPKVVYCDPGKWGKRFKYLHNFLIETRTHLLAQELYLKKDLLKLCLKFNILNFKSTPLGKCLQSRVDAETAVFKSSLVFFHESPFLEFKHYPSMASPIPILSSMAESASEREKGLPGFIQISVSLGLQMRPHASDDHGGVGLARFRTAGIQ